MDIPTNEFHQQLKKDVESIVNKHSDKMSAEEILALMSQMVGIVIALQDQTKHSSAYIMELVGKNIELGNMTVINDLVNNTGGNG